MQKLKDTSFYGEAINEITYSFGNYYLFDGFVVAEINEDVIFTWEQHGKIITNDLTDLYDTNGNNVVLITNRINSYSVKPADWIHFFKHSYKLKGYAIVTYSTTSYLNALLEKFFLNTRFKRFQSLSEAIAWAKSIAHDRTKVS